MKRYYFSLLPSLLLSFSISSCGSNTSPGKVASKAVRSPNVVDSQQNAAHKTEHLAAGKSESVVNISTKEYVGVIVINSKAQFSDGFNFKVFNDDLTTWKDVRFAPTLVSAEIKPYLFNYDNYLLIFKCVEKINDYYKVVINEFNHALKLISVKEKNLVFHSWEQHILNDAFSVDFDFAQNPLREKPQEKSITKHGDKNQIYHPTKIEGDWLKLKDDDNKEGWIKWRDEKGILIINLFYDA